MAGHSKWANIQHRKGRQDAARSKRFSKLSKEITVAARMGDPDPEKNPRLRLAVKEAKASSMPKDNIDRAIKKASGGDADTYEEIRYEGYGPNGVAIIVEAMTDNRNRTASNIRSTFSKRGGNLGETGSVAFLFDRKGQIVYPARAGSEEAVLEAAIEAGAEDVESSEDGHVVWCADGGLAEVSAALEAALGEAEFDQARLAAADHHRARPRGGAGADAADRGAGGRRRRAVGDRKRRNPRRRNGAAVTAAARRAARRAHALVSRDRRSRPWRKPFLLPSCERLCGEVEWRMRLLSVLLALALVAGAAAAAPDVVMGTASYRERIALPPGAVFEAVLEDVSLTDAPAVELGRTMIADPGNPPFAFEIDFDPAEVQEDHTYSVRAQVSVGRKLIFVSDKMNPVLTHGAGNEVQIWMIKVGGTAQEAQAAPTQIGAHGLRLPGSFAGDLPCDDCDGLRYRLNLWADQVFHLRRTWEGTDNRRDAVGRWSVDPDRRLLTLRGAEEPLTFEILGPDRIRLMPPGGIPAGEAESYVLTAGSEFRSFEPHLPLRGMLTYDAESARFTECLTGRDYPLVQDGDYAALEHAYLAAGAEPGGPIMASFDGAILQPGSDSNGEEQPAVLVERFVGVWPDETCERTETTASLTNTYWKILRIGEDELAVGEGRREPNLILRQDERRFTATVGCNQLTGEYSLVGDVLSFGTAAATMMACEPPLDAWEAKLGDLLARTVGFRIDGQTLELLDATGGSLGLFQAVYLY